MKVAYMIRRSEQLQVELTIQRRLCSGDTPRNKAQCDGEPSSLPTDSPLPSRSSSLGPPRHDNPEIHRVQRNLHHVYEALRRRAPVFLQPRLLPVHAVHGGIVAVWGEDRRVPFVAWQSVRS